MVYSISYLGGLVNANLGEMQNREGKSGAVMPGGRIGVLSGSPWLSACHIVIKVL